jgi:hypothetical protein
MPLGLWAPLFAVMLILLYQIREAGAIIFLVAPILVVIEALMLLCSRLTIAVENGRLSWSFAFGAFRQSVSVDEIQKVAVYSTISIGVGWRMGSGWGTLWTPGCRTAVGMAIRNYGYVSLGTNEPEALVGAIEAAAGRALRVETPSDPLLR